MANERRLIDANALPRNIWLDGNVLVMSVNEIDSAPTVDAIVPVRCRDCVHFKTEEWHNVCLHAEKGIVCPEPTDFCSYGERKCK